jgi:predicted amidohydrolase YtcJ
MTQDARNNGRVSRRNFIMGAAAAGAAMAAGGSVVNVANARTPTAPPPPVCAGVADVALINGNILTMDANNTVVNAVTIRDGRFAEVGVQGPLGACAQQVIDLKGATVVPGLIDSHLHFIRDGLNPGHEVRSIEVAASVGELQQMIAARIQSLPVPAGEFVTCVGGWNRNGMGGNLPTLAQLDAAAPSNPVFITETGGGGAGVTNSLGMSFFVAAGVPVDPSTGILNAANGFIALRVARDTGGDPRIASRQTSTNQAIDFATSLGLTMVHDQGGNGGVTGNPSLFVDLTPYDEALNLWRQNNLNLRIRSWLYSDTDTGFSIAESRILNNYARTGDDVFRLQGCGERVNVSTTDPGFIPYCLFAANNLWTVTQHSSTQAEIMLHISAYQGAYAQNLSNGKASLRDLRWSLCHINTATIAQIQSLVDIGVGTNIQGTAYTSGTLTGGSGGTPFRDILDLMIPAGLPVGGGSDGTNVGAMNPWLMMYFMITGKNNAGIVINTPGQSCTRMEALRMYTMGSAALSFDDDRLGSIQPGKLADLAVLTGNPLTVTEDQFKRLQSKMTMQGGRIVSGAAT